MASWFISMATKLLTQLAPVTPSGTPSPRAPVTTAWRVAGSDFSLAPSSPYLQTGTNVLAIQLLNQSSSSSDLLIAPTLTAQTGAGVISYLATPTPGAPNSAIAQLGPRIDPVVAHADKPRGRPADNDHRPSHSVCCAGQCGVRRPHLPRDVRQRSQPRHVRRRRLGRRRASPATAFTRHKSPALRSSPAKWCAGTSRLPTPSGITSRAPSYLDPLDSPQYYGTVVVDPTVTTSLPVIYWFVQDTNAAATDTGTRASLYYRRPVLRQHRGRSSRSDRPATFNSPRSHSTSTPTAASNFNSTARSAKSAISICSPTTPTKRISAMPWLTGFTLTRAARASTPSPPSSSETASTTVCTTSSKKLNPNTSSESASIRTAPLQNGQRLRLVHQQRRKENSQVRKQQRPAGPRQHFLAQREPRRGLGRRQSRPRGLGQLLRRANVDRQPRLRSERTTISIAIRTARSSGRSFRGTWTSASATNGIPPKAISTTIWSTTMGSTSIKAAII